MKLNQLPNLRAEDFPSQQSWIGKLFIQLNPFIQAVNNVFDQNIDFGTNIKSLTRLYNITSFQQFNFEWPFLEQPPQEVTVISATKGSTPTILVLAWSYDVSQRLITVTRMSEITSTGVSDLSGRYQFTIRASV